MIANEKTHSAKYQVLCNRLTNGTSFTTDTAQARITALADALEITQEEADELFALAKEHGTSGATLEERVAALEERALEHEEALVELAGMMTGSGVERANDGHCNRGVLPAGVHRHCEVHSRGRGLG